MKIGELRYTTWQTELSTKYFSYSWKCSFWQLHRIFFLSFIYLSVCALYIYIIMLDVLENSQNSGNNKRGGVGRVSKSPRKTRSTFSLAFIMRLCFYFPYTSATSCSCSISSTYACIKCIYRYIATALHATLQWGTIKVLFLAGHNKNTQSPSDIFHLLYRYTY